jgi:hypothetical protein
MRSKAILSLHWYALPDDVVGGWCIMTANVPPSQVNWRDPTEDTTYRVGSFLSKEIAEYVVSLHNSNISDLARLNAA